MFETIEIKNFRCFRELHVEGLRPVNLIVGKNNGGKTTLLDAVGFLAQPTDPHPLWHALVERGELLGVAHPNAQQTGHLADVRHLFFGHAFSAQQSIEFRTAWSDTITMRARKNGEHHEVNLNVLSDGETPRLRVTHRVVDTMIDEELWDLVRTSEGWGIPVEKLSPVPAWGLNRSPVSLPRPRVCRIGALSLTSDFVAKRWREIALTGEKNLVLYSLQAIDAEIIDFAYIGQDTPSWLPRPTTGVVVLLSGATYPVPIGSLGEGTWRLLVMLLALVRARGGVLLIDEIDSGLHHTVQNDMWRVVAETAMQNEVQVFATTHSQDCVIALAAACKDLERQGRHDIASIQRVESGNPRAVSYSEQELLAAAQHHIEVR